MANRAGPLLALLVITLPFGAQPPKKPWLLTLEERIALRSDPALARERVRERERVSAHSTSNRELATVMDDFDGKTHPELFMPHEVFETLIHMSFWTTARSGVLTRQGLTSEIKRIGLPDDFWLRLESLSAPYVADLWELEDLWAKRRQQTGAARARTDDAIQMKNTDICRNRANALSGARNAFGRERFDRLLYEVIARGMFRVSDKVSDPALLRRLDGGCR